MSISSGGRTGAWNIRWNKEGFPFANQVINDAVAFTDAYFDVTFQLIKIFFRIDLMKIVSCQFGPLITITKKSRPS